MLQIGYDMNYPCINRIWLMTQMWQLWKQCQGWNILCFLLHSLTSPIWPGAFLVVVPLSSSSFSSEQRGETLQGRLIPLTCCVTVTLFWQDTEKPWQPAARKKKSYLSLSLNFFCFWGGGGLELSSSSGVEGSRRPVRGNLCCVGGKTPRGSLHICSDVAQGWVGAK